MVAHDALSPWESFHVIVGSSAAALTGLQFVVIALINETEWRTGAREIEAFGTPTVVHFCAVLLSAAVLSAPWPSLAGAAGMLGIVGVLGALYVLITARRARRTTNYKPVLEDWVWHVILPFAAYVAIVIGAAFLARHPERALFSVAGAEVLLLFVGIHNAWDTVTYIALGPGPPQSAVATTTTTTQSTEPQRVPHDA